MSDTTLSKDLATGTHHLTLTSDQAQAVAQVLGKVGGCPTTSPRQHIDAVLAMLLEAGVRDDAGRLVFNGESLWFEAEKT